MNKEDLEILEQRGFKVKTCYCIISDEDYTFYIQNEEEFKQFVDDQKGEIEE